MHSVSCLLALSLGFCVSPTPSAQELTAASFIRCTTAKHPLLDGYLVVTGTSRSRVGCVALSQEINCSSLLYNSASGECQGFSAWMTYPGQPQSDWVYYRRQDANDSTECRPDAVANGEVSPASVTEGGTVQYSCHTGYELSAGDIRTCSAGTLSGEQPLCELARTYYQLRIQSTNEYWRISDEVDRLLKSSSVVDDLAKFYVEPDPASDYMRIFVKGTGNFLHEDASVGSRLNARWQPDDQHTWFRFNLQNDNTYTVDAKSGFGHIALQPDGVLRATLEAVDSNSKFYLELNGSIVNI